MAPHPCAAPKPRKGTGILEKQAMRIGSNVVYIDPTGRKHNALVTHVWGKGLADAGGAEPGCNLLFVVHDETKTDPYGRQIERSTSVVHRSVQPAGVSCWCWPNEVSLDD